MDYILVTRALERVLIVLSAAMCIYLGFRLILALPENRDGEGKMTLASGFTIYISRLGPGAFFALFGCVVLMFSLRNALTVGHPGSPGENRDSDQTIQYASEQIKVSPSPQITYLQSRSAAMDEEFGWLPDDVLDDLFLLNQLPDAIDDKIGSSLKNELDALAARNKLRVLHPHWQNEWCSEIAFRDWVNTGSSGSPPENSEIPLKLFNFGRVAK